MSLTVRLPEELARRVEQVAAQRGTSPEQVAIETIDAALAVSGRLGFIGMGHSGRGDLSGRVKELRREVAEERLDGERRSADG